MGTNGLKVEDRYDEFPTNDVEIFRIICPVVFYKIDFLKDFVKKTPVLEYLFQKDCSLGLHLYYKRDSNTGPNFLKTAIS